MPFGGPMCHLLAAPWIFLWPPHFSSNVVLLRMGLLLPGASRLRAESWRTEWPSPKSSCLSRSVTSTTQGVRRNAGLVVIFHVINKDSFV